MKIIFQIIIIINGFINAQTAGQIENAKKLIKKSGMSKQQVIDAAKARGYSDSQIDAVIQREKKSNKGGIEPQSKSTGDTNILGVGKSNESTNNKSVSVDSPLINENTENSNEESILNLESKTQTSKQRLSYFGYDIFARDPALFQSTSVGAVDPNYLIGPGDNIIVMLWGETQFRQVLTVDREGFVFIPEIGQVFVNGLNLNLLESKLFRVFSQSYASLNPDDRTPTTFLDVSLGDLRPLRIQVLGEVAQPGAYTVSPSATLFSSLYYFNGPTTLGSLRDIQLIRGGKKVISIDFYDYLLTGKKPKDQKLQLDDVIFIPRRMKTVTIEGEINRPGIFEIKPEEGLADLINLAGDLKVTAYLDRAQIDRIVPFENREELGMDRNYTDVNLKKFLNPDNFFPMQDGDHIQIYSVLDMRQNVVDLRGAVTRPGSYDLGDSLRISELIDKADGLLGDAYLSRVDIVRVKSDFTEKLIKLNLRKAMEGNLDNNIKLQGLDKVRVYGMNEMISESYVSITGNVKQPGRFLLQEDMKLYDLIFKSGSFLDEEFKKRTYLDRADILRLNEDRITRTIISFNLGKLLESPDSKENFNLKAGDIIKIYQKDIFIENKPLSISGVVRNPGTYFLKKNMTLKDLVFEAGGLTANVYNYRVELARIDPHNTNLEEYAKIITFNMDEKFDINLDENNLDLEELTFVSDTFHLAPYDYISIRPNPFFTMQKKVSILGEVMYPGNYAILNSNEKITDIIDRAGGLLPNAYPEASIYSRKGIQINTSMDKIIKNPKSKLNFKVQDGDEIRIVPHPNIINMSGEVNSPGIHKFVSGKRVSYYINLAGGLNPNADKSNIWIEYPSGDSKIYKPTLFKNPKVIDGSTINIGRLKDSEPFDRTEFAKEVTAIIANLAQALAVVFLAAK